MHSDRTPTLQDFIDEEMLRAPLLFDQVVDTVMEQWRQAMGAAMRHGIDAVRVLQNHRGDLVGEAARSLREQVQANRSAAPSTAPAPPARLELSLIGEDEVTVDIEIARAVERVKSMAEFELRELQAYTSALVGDFNVSKDTNPFRPEAYVRALWDGTRQLPMNRAAHASFLRDAADPLARTLKQGYAAACTRLDDGGVEPAVYRTIVVTPTGRSPAPDQTLPVGVSLQDIRDSMPAPEAPVPGAHPAPGAVNRVDHQLVDLLSRLFDAIQSDRNLPPSCLALLLRLHPTALRLAVQDTSMLDDYDHPVWRFMDRLAFGIATAHVLEQERWLNFARQLVDHLVGDGSADTARFVWALGRVEAYERHCLERAALLAQPEITNLQLASDKSAQPIDVETMDTVPAELLPELGHPDGMPSAPRLHLKPGEFMRAYLQGDWRLLQLLWMDSMGEVWLLADAAAPRHWALRLSAVERLAAEQLALPLRPRSLVRSAADRMLRSMPPTR